LGAKIALGGTVAEVEGSNSGLFILPSIFTGVSNRMRIAQEEIFGPVLGIISFHDEDEAVAIANETNYGLAAGICRAVNVSARVRARTVWVSTYLSRGELHVAVWRLQEQRLRPRKRPAFDRGIFADQECLD
jgi:(Z)-2-((N-methylformamido)methylene)-5-hydroxybutyrolactone dehydrogenase